MARALPVEFCPYCQRIINSILAHADSSSKIYIELNRLANPPENYRVIRICDGCIQHIRRDLEEEADGFIVEIP